MSFINLQRKQRHSRQSIGVVFFVIFFRRCVGVATIFRVWSLWKSELPWAEFHSASSKTTWFHTRVHSTRLSECLFGGCGRRNRGEIPRILQLSFAPHLLIAISDANVLSHSFCFFKKRIIDLSQIFLRAPIAHEELVFLSQSEDVKKHLAIPYTYTTWKISLLSYNRTSCTSKSVFNINYHLRHIY